MHYYIIHLRAYFLAHKCEEKGVARAKTFEHLPPKVQ